ncbi:MAG TPA: hypothetical protein VF760_10350, partial [Xanthobacteraceae bacterium]
PYRGVRAMRYHVIRGSDRRCVVVHADCAAAHRDAAARSRLFGFAYWVHYVRTARKAEGKS